MFGHEKGSFTGAVDHKIGAFEAANHGTLFLDEIGELSLEQQSKLLRALEALTIQRVGSSRQIPLNIRIISATNRNLEEEISANHFRSDLFYRIYVVPINLPPLRFRPDDIPSLAEHFLSLYCQKYWGAKKMTISPPAIESLQRRRWPGNIRELRNVMERAIITCQQPMLTRKDVEGACYRLDFDYFACDQENRFGKVKEMERDLILKELERNNWNKQLTARTLGMAKSTLFEKIKKYEIRLNRDSQYCPDQLNG
jgi:DNA-binding NtrC family response regulator